MNEPGNFMIRRFDAGYIRAGRDCGYFKRPVRGIDVKFFEMRQVDIAVIVVMDNRYRSNGLQPTGMVTMVFHMGNEYDGPRDCVYFDVTSLSAVRACAGPVAAAIY
jgi:hypothetical protein